MAVKSPEFTVVMMDPAKLKPHVQNWRKHDKRQRDAYHALREKLGIHIWLKAVIYNEKTETLIDGHMRVEEAIKNKEKRIPVRVIDVTEEVEKLILQMLDPIGLLAGADIPAVQALTQDNRSILRKAKTKTNKVLAQLSKDMAIHKYGIRRSPSVRTKVDSPEPDARRSDGGYEPSDAQSILEEHIVNNDVKFSSSNEWELPDLLPDMLATPDLAPRDTWAKGVEHSKGLLYCCHGTRPFPESLPGIGVLGFYTDDSRFNHIYAEADLFASVLKEERWQALIAPDFSAYEGWPFPEQLFNIYKSRWCARLWQELGFKVVPSLEDIGPRTKDVIYSTLPDRCPVVSLQTRNSSSNEKLIAQIKAAMAVHPDTILLYGGADKEKYLRPYLPKKVEYVFLQDSIRKRRKK